jgi:hypothetical protein
VGSVTCRGGQNNHVVIAAAAGWRLAGAWRYRDARGGMAFMQHGVVRAVRRSRCALNTSVLAEQEEQWRARRRQRGPCVAGIVPMTTKCVGIERAAWMRQLVRQLALLWEGMVLLCLVPLGLCLGALWCRLRVLWALGLFSCCAVVVGSCEVFPALCCLRSLRGGSGDDGGDISGARKR